MFLVDRNDRRRRLLETALELEGLTPETEVTEVEADADAEVFVDDEHNERIIMMSPKAARRFRIRPLD